MADLFLQPIYKRQRFLLAFIRQLEDGVTSMEIQKLVLLYSMRNQCPYYEFIPYKYGSYSFQLAEDIEILRRENYLSTDHNRIRAKGAFRQDTFFSIDTERGDPLNRKAYREYPYYTINSEMIDRLFNGEEAERFKNGKQRYTKTCQVLFTLGYEGRTVEAFINTLIKNDIRLLCDVRKNPISRKFGFSKSKLKHITETVGIKYTHIPELGIESNKRSSLNTIEDYHTLFEDYTKTLSFRESWLMKIYELLLLDKRIALMCFEKEPDMCHRHIIRDYIVDRHKVRSEDL